MELATFLNAALLFLALTFSASVEVSGANLHHTASSILSQNLTRRLASRVYDEEICWDDSYNNIGICTNSSECSSRGGSSIGSCWSGQVCCRIIARCPSPTAPCAIRHSGTTVVNENSTAGYRRTYRFQKSENVCQLRLDFDEFSLAQPDERGNCVEDSMQIPGLAICGKNTQQHVYLDFGYRSTLDINMRIRDVQSKYKIRATFIECSSEIRAPPNCLQYFTDFDGTVKSFNFGHQQLNNLQYSICVKGEDDVKQIQWKACANTPDAFFISGSGFTSSPKRTPNCERDWVQIFGKDRYCGKGFSTISSMAKPFLVDVRFDEVEGFGVELPTNPEDCNGAIITDPYTGGAFVCSSDGYLGGCTCEFIIPDSADPEELLNLIDSGNTGFCLDYEQQW